jgi:hypothetical protein
MGRSQSTASATIASGAALSGAVCLGDKVLAGIQMPAAWTAASLTFQVSFDAGTTWKDLYDDAGVEVTLSPTSPAGKYLAVDPSAFAGVVFLKVRSGTTGTPVNQAADRSFTLVTRKFYALD